MSNETIGGLLGEVEAQFSRLAALDERYRQSGEQYWAGGRCDPSEARRLRAEMREGVEAVGELVRRTRLCLRAASFWRPGAGHLRQEFELALGRVLPEQEEVSEWHLALAGVEVLAEIRNVLLEVARLTSSGQSAASAVAGTPPADLAGGELADVVAEKLVSRLERASPAAAIQAQGSAAALTPGAVIPKAVREQDAARLAQDGGASGVKPRLLSIEQGGAYVSRTEEAMRHLIQAGKIPTVRADRRIYLDIADLDRWIEQNKGQPVK